MVYLYTETNQKFQILFHNNLVIHIQKSLNPFALTDSVQMATTTATATPLS